MEAGVEMWEVPGRRRTLGSWGSLEKRDQADEEDRRRLAAICRRLYERGLSRATGGNVSVRRVFGEVLITPSGSCLGDVTEDRLVSVNLAEDPSGAMFLRGNETVRPSSELPLHRALYRVLPDCHAIVHVHSPFAVTLAVAGSEIPAHTAEAEHFLGKIPLLPHLPSGSEELAEQVAAAASDPSVRGVLMENHGPVTWAADLMTAYYQAELLEEMAELHYRLENWR